MEPWSYGLFVVLIRRHSSGALDGQAIRPVDWIDLRIFDLEAMRLHLGNAKWSFIRGCEGVVLSLAASICVRSEAVRGNAGSA